LAAEGVERKKERKRGSKRDVVGWLEWCWVLCWYDVIMLGEQSLRGKDKYSFLCVDYNYTLLTN
jgi:hypothetical protein